MNVLFFLQLLCVVVVLAGEKAMAETNDLVVTHAPVTSAFRGVPVNITATIETAPGSTVTSAVVLVRLTDAGTPIRTAMGRSGEGVYSTILPVSMIRSVSVFWYALDARNDQGHVGGTPWIRVVIADPLMQDSTAGSASFMDWKTAGLIGAGLLAVGGTVAIIANQDDDNENDGGEPAPVTDPPPPKNNPTPPPSSGDGSKPPDLSGLTNFICQVTGNESATYENLSRCESTDDILILICRTCLNANIQAQSSWGEVSSITGYSNVGCNTGAPRLRLPKPRGFPTPGTESFTVTVNGIIVDTVVWPPLSDNACF